MRRAADVDKRFLAGLALSVGLLGLLFTRVEPARVVDALASARPAPVLGGALIYFGALWLKIARWAVILGAVPHPPPASDPARRWLTADSLFLGFLGNYVLPARLGEVARSMLYARRAEVGLGSVLATVAVGRLLDAGVLALAFFAAIELGALPTTLPTWLPEAARGVGGLALLLLVALALAERMLPTTSIDAEPSGLWRRGVALLHRTVVSVRQGLAILRSPGRSAAALALTGAVWAAEVTAMLVLMRAFGHALPLAAGVLQTVGGGYAAAAPAAPGALGVHQWVTVLTLGPFGVEAGVATAASLLQTMFVLAWTVPLGLFGLWRQGSSLGQLKAQLVVPPRTY